MVNSKVQVVVYALYNSKHNNATEAAKSKDWVYVGKTILQINETSEQAAQRVLKEHQSDNRHGTLLEEALGASPKLGCTYVTVKMSQEESIKNPTKEELNRIKMYSDLGAKIKNTKK